MDETTVSDSTDTTTVADQGEQQVEQVDELLVEEISIDGMCGVY